MDKIKMTFGYVGYTLLVIATLDLLVVMYTMFVVGMGGNVINIPFWDNQIRFIINLLS